MITFNTKDKTIDGVPATYLEMHKQMTWALSEGRDIIRTDGQTTEIVKGWTTTDEETKEILKGWAMTDEQTATTTDGHVTGTTDGQTTMTTDVQTTVTDGQTTLTTDEQTTVTDVQTTTLMTEMEEEVMMEDVDPLASSPPSPTLMMDSDDLTISHHSLVDSHLAAPIPLGDVEHEGQKMDDGDGVDEARPSTSGIARRVAGRRRAVVMDDDSETASVVSISSADEGSSMATSSSCIKGRKGVKRGRETMKEKGRTKEGSSEERKRKKTKEKEKKREIGKNKDTPEKEEEVGKYGEPKGVVAHVFEDMSSSVLGGAIQEWASTIEDIRVKSKNIQGRLSGDMKKCVANIIEGAALLVVRTEATGDPQFLRMRNSELMARLREAENENSRLREQLKRKSPGMSSPPPRKSKEKVVKKVAKEAATDSAQVDSADPVDQPLREDFPPLPQRPPREARDGDKKRPGPRIVSDVRVALPFKERRKEAVATLVESGSEMEWRVAAGRGRKGRIKGDKPLPLAPPPPPPPIPVGRQTPVRQQQQQQKKKVRLPRPLAYTAVTVTGRAEGFSYKDAMINAREHIKLESLGITVSRVRKALNGGLLIEVSGEDARPKAEELVTRLRSVFKESAAVACPMKKRELSVVGFDESVSSEEIAEALSCIGCCPVTDIKMGPIRTLRNGLCMIWVQLPVEAATKAAEEGKVRVGWTIARVELLKVRPLQCYKCWSFGHMQNMCRNVVDRRGACFRCGQKGHVASTCGNPVHCAVCHDAGLEAAHRLGSPKCVAHERQGEKK